MKILKTIIFVLLMSAYSTLGWANTEKIDYKAKYVEKQKVNNDTIGIIAGVINYVCPKLVSKSTKICKVKDPVGSAVGFQKQLLGKGDIDDLDDISDKELKAALKKRKILHKEGAMQFYDAVEQFKMHYPERKLATDFAAKKKWRQAFQHEEMAWQFLVKCASRGIFAKKMVDGE
ncbi:MAG: hypothetical protein HOE90_07370 [Bacteriovoracaceae bacterium]|nr:hypothetical protein [Bacteriovoracaceae bacterium]